MTLIEQIEALGYKLHRGWTSAFKPDVENIHTYDGLKPYDINYWHFCIESPNGKVTNISGKLDSKIVIGGKISTTKEELTKEFFKPSDEEWFIFQHGYSVEMDKKFKSAYRKHGLIEYSIDDSCCLKEIECIEKKSIKTPFLNAEEPMLMITKDKYVIEFTVRNDIDSWTVYRFWFDKLPDDTDIVFAYDVSQLQLHMKIGRISEEDAENELERIGG